MKSQMKGQKKIKMKSVPVFQPIGSPTTIWVFYRPVGRGTSRWYEHWLSASGSWSTWWRFSSVHSHAHLKIKDVNTQWLYMLKNSSSSARPLPVGAKYT